jgi:hypothetical protein
VCGKRFTGIGFFQGLQFPLPIIPPVLTSHLSSRACIVGPFEATTARDSIYSYSTPTLIGVKT